MARPKDQGTALETALVVAARTVGLRSRRLAEGGSGDEGDVELYDTAGRRHIVECKARETLSVHPAYVKAAAKGKQADPTARVALLWKRLIKQPGRTRRVAAGPPLIAIPLHDYLDLLCNQADLDDAA